MRLDVQPENIPDRLRALPRWGGWKLESTADGKPTKVPYRADRPDELASSTDPSTWGDFETALAAYRAGQIDGIGFRLGEGITGLDIDHCISAGVLEPKARHCLDVLQSYSELSQSGTGIHTIVYGEKPGHRCKHNGFELYSHGRYFCMTGRRLRDYPPAWKNDRRNSPRSITRSLVPILSQPRPPRRHRDRRSVMPKCWPSRCGRRMAIGLRRCGRVTRVVTTATNLRPISRSAICWRSIPVVTRVRWIGCFDPRG